MDFWINNVCSECWGRFGPGHEHDRSACRTVIIMVPDRVKQPQLRWTLTAHIVAHAVWNQSERKLRYTWSDTAGDPEHRLEQIGSGLKEAGGEVAGDVTKVKTEITVQMTGSGNACFHAHTRPDVPNVAFVGIVPFAIGSFVKTMKMDKSGRLKYMGSLIYDFNSIV